MRKFYVVLATCALATLAFAGTFMTHHPQTVAGVGGSAIFNPSELTLPLNLPTAEPADAI